MLLFSTLFTGVYAAETSENKQEAIKVENAEKAMAMDSLEIARMLVDIHVPREEITEICMSCTAAKLAEIINGLEAGDIVSLRGVALGWYNGPQITLLKPSEVHVNTIAKVRASYAGSDIENVTVKGGFFQKIIAWIVELLNKFLAIFKKG